MHMHEEKRSATHDRTELNRTQMVGPFRKAFYYTSALRCSFARGEGKQASAPMLLAPGWVLQRDAALLENWVVFAMASGSAEGGSSSRISWTEESGACGF